MADVKAAIASENADESGDEEPGEEVESAPPMKIGEERELGSSGVKKKLIKRGHGWETPSLGDEATVHYVCTLSDGKKFYSTRDRNQPLRLKLGKEQLIKGLDDGIITMTKGEIAVFTLPAGESYGVVSPDSLIELEVELVSWLSVAQVSSDGGIIKKVIKRGDKFRVPGEDDEVLVKYRVQLVDGTIVAESPEGGVEFVVKDGHLCPAIPKAILAMTKGEKASFVVQPQYGFGELGSDELEGFSLIPPNSVLNIDLELVSFKPVLRISEDGKVLKKIIKEGQGPQADEGATVTISYTGRLEDGSIFEKKGIDGEAPLKFVTDEGISGLDIAVSSMQKGELAVVTIYPDYGFGSVEVKRDLLVVPPSSTLTYEIEMLNLKKEKPLWQMNDEEKMENAERKKEEGNLLFKSGKYQRAAKKYDKALQYITDEESFGIEVALSKPLIISCRLNGAACSLKLNNFHKAVELCSKVLDAESYNVKALYRRAQAYMALDDLVSADLDIKKAIELDPENRDLQLIQRNLKQLKAASNKRDAKLYANMLPREPTVTSAEKFPQEPTVTSAATPVKKFKVDQQGEEEMETEDDAIASVVKNLMGSFSG